MCHLCYCNTIAKCFEMVSTLKMVQSYFTKRYSRCVDKERCDSSQPQHTPASGMWGQWVPSPLLASSLEQAMLPCHASHSEARGSCWLQIRSRANAQGGITAACVSPGWKLKPRAGSAPAVCLRGSRDLRSWHALLNSPAHQHSQQVVSRLREIIAIIES